MGKNIVGHAAVSAVKINKRDQNCYGLGPVAVLPEYQNRGIGTALTGEGIKRFKSQGAAGIVVVGAPDFCCRFSFRREHGLKLADVSAEYFQALALSSELPEGEVFYHPTFLV